jgi:signal transduction histidine kinase/CheY-like chemotaxis protein
MPIRLRPLFRAADPPRGLKTAVTLWALFTAACFVAILWAYDLPGFAWMWPANGILTAALLLLPRRWALATAGACVVSNLAAGMMFGAPFDKAMLYCMLNAGEAFLAAFLARQVCGAAIDLSHRRRFFNFLGLVALPTSTLIATVAALVIGGYQHKAFPAAWAAWFPADLLGLAVVTPTVLLLAQRRRFDALSSAGLAETAGLMAGMAAITGAVFSQTTEPLVFLLFPALVLATFRLPPPGVACVVLVAALIATPLTIVGYGPIAAVQGFTAVAKGQLLQLFIAALFLSALPASSALTERRRMKLRLYRRMAAVREARRHAEQAGEAKTQFLAVMSHEIRTPLNGLLGFAQVMQSRADLPADVRRQVELMSGSCDVLLALVNDVLDFSKIEAGRVELDPRPCSLQAVIEGAAAVVAPAARQKRLPIDLDLAALEDLRHVVDDQRVTQVLLNLLSNAVKFTARGGVAVTAEVVPGGCGRDLVRIAVRDTGVGVPEDRRDRLFKAFSQADSSTTRTYGGTGLGLVISRRLVELMGGSLGYEPVMPHGSEFWLSLSLPRAADEAGALAEAAEIDLQGMRVLVVDDHPVNREVASLMLTAAGCHASACADGAAAVEAVRDEAFDLVLMDVHMPGMDGLDAARAIRALPGRAGRTPIVALTADTASADVGRCLEAGMNGHLGKPIRQQQLLETAADWTPRARLRRDRAA